MKRMSCLFLLLIVAALALRCAPSEPAATAPAAGESEVVHLRILAINDFHGHIATSPDPSPRSPPVWTGQWTW